MSIDKKENRKGFFNTLEYHNTHDLTETNDSNVFGLHGEGADLQANKLSGWIRKKSLMQKLTLSLISVAKKKNRSPKYINSLWNTYNCMQKVYTVNGKIYTKYCRNKLCSVCNGIKKAKMINDYLPIVKQWKDPQFVTLTIKSIYKYKLVEYLNKGMNRGLSKILNKYNHKNRNGTGVNFIGIRSLECNFNPKKRTYNPHFHVIVPDIETAELLVKEWMGVCKNLAGPKSQKIRPVKDLEKDLIEVIKYGTKIFTDPTMSKGKKKMSEYKIYVSAFENILFAFGNTRRHGHFGFKLNKPKKTISTVEIKTEIKEWKFDVSRNDWVDKNNELLVGKTVDRTAINHFDSILDSEAE